MITRIYKGSAPDSDPPSFLKTSPKTGGKAPRGKFDPGEEDDEEDDEDDEDDVEEDEDESGGRKGPAPRPAAPPLPPTAQVPPPPAGGGRVQKAVPLLGALASGAGRAIAGAASSIASRNEKKDDPAMKGTAPRGHAAIGKGHPEPDGDEDEDGNEPPGPEEKTKKPDQKPPKGLAPRGL